MAQSAARFASLILALALVGLAGTAHAKPDLTVTDIKLEPAGSIDGHTIAATIKNIGPDGTSIFLNIDITMYLDGVKCDTGIIIAGLGAGKTANEDTGACNPKTPGTHKIKFVVDSTSEVDESNESNNALEKTFTWGPDLVVTGITIDPAKPGIGDGKITATVKNQGPTGIGTFINLDMAMYLDGKKCDDGIVIAGLGAGSTANEDTTSCNPTTPGPHVFRIEVDSTKEVPESSESNNSLEKTFTWTAPDLVVTKIVVDNLKPAPNQSVKFTTTLKNQGTIGTGQVIINMTYHLDGAATPCDDGLILFGLGAGSDTTDDSTKCTPKTGGPHTLTVKIDTDKDVVETDENNNELTQTFDFQICGATELCNGKDDNCDGTIDEGFLGLGVACDGPDADDCKNGKNECSPDGKVVVCTESGTASAELCDGKDNDCDGKVDEDWAALGKECVAQKDGCTVTGTKACKSDGSDVECVATGEPPAETCNGKDDDCDGETDEDFPEVGEPCAAGLGACRTIGEYACSSGGVACNALPSAPAAAEACGDGLDDDCDGTADEGCECEPGTFQLCGSDVGACKMGTLSCKAVGVFAISCVGAVGPKDEQCNDLDDDCDGSVDEGCSCTTGTTRSCDAEAGVCANGTQTCTGAEWGPCVAAVAMDTNCDGVDDDCDGLADPICGCTPGDMEACDVTPDDCADYLRACGDDGVMGPCEPLPDTIIDGCGPFIDEPGEDIGGGGEVDAGGGGGGGGGDKDAGGGGGGGSDKDAGGGGGGGGDDASGPIDFDSTFGGFDSGAGGGGAGATLSSDGGCAQTGSAPAVPLAAAFGLLLLVALRRRAR